MSTLRINEIFLSIDGEVNTYHQGHLTVFVRLAGCNLRCSYCDTKKAWEKDSGKEMSFEEILSEIKKYNINKVTITGGEPLMQENLVGFLEFMASTMYALTIETSGSFPIPEADFNASWVVDYKTSFSGEKEKMAVDFSSLGWHDFIKILANEKDINFQELESIITELYSVRRPGIIPPRIAVSIPEESFSNKKWIGDLIAFLAKEGFSDVLVNVQIHKFIGVE